MRILIGIDDTDNKESRGTGFNSRQLAAAIEREGYGKVKGITRHQLLVHPDIPFTSQNSSACLEVECNELNEIIDFSTEFMRNIGAPGSDVGLCILPTHRVPEGVKQWGMRAKSEVLHMKGADDLAKHHGIYLIGLTGTHGGIIGALAAVGLRAGGNDGRFIWINSAKNLRDIEQDVHSVEVLLTRAGIDVIQCGDTIIDDPDAMVFLNGWARPVLRNGQSVLLVDHELNNKKYEWKCSAKEAVKELSN